MYIYHVYTVSVLDDNIVYFFPADQGPPTYNEGTSYFKKTHMYLTAKITELPDALIAGISGSNLTKNHSKLRVIHHHLAPSNICKHKNSVQTYKSILQVFIDMK